MSDTPEFKSREAFLSFLDNINNNPYDDTPTLRNYITRLYYHNSMPVLNKADILCSCIKSCTVLSVGDTEKYIDKLVDIGFLTPSSEANGFYLNTEFYNPDRFAMGTPSVDLAGEDKEGE